MSGRLSKPALRRLAGLALVLGAAGGAGMAQSAPITYPASRSPNDLAAWLQRDTPLAPSQIVDISPQAVTAVTSATPMGETRGFLANISSEAVDPEMLAHDGIASWSIPVEVDCAKRQVRLGVMTGYRSRDLSSEGRVVREADTAWVNPTPTAPLGSVIKALCDRDFRRPLVGKGKAVAFATREKPVPAKPASATPTVVAKADPPGPALRGPVTPAQDGPKPTAAPVAHAGGGAFAVQVGASPSLPDIQGLLARFKKTFAADLGGLGTSVATVQVGGKTVNRALVTGFGSNAEAGAFCKALAARGQACFVRR